MIRLLVVDDSSFMVSLIKSLLKAAPDIEVIGSAESAQEALDRVRELKPDCVTMDINLPDRDGVEAVRDIMAVHPVPIIMLSAYSEKAARVTLKALEYGAVDFIQKPGGEVTTRMNSANSELIAKIRTAAATRVRLIPRVPEPSPPAAAVEIPAAARPPARIAVAIGISTGGPRLLKQILPLFSPGLSAAVLISQHMPASYTPTLVEQLNQAQGNLQVRQAGDLMDILEGTAYLSPGDFHLTVINRKIVLRKPEAADITIPSADLMFESVSESFRQNCLGVVLTGMGQDGERGIRTIKKNGGFLIAQNEESSTVFGMPKAAIATGLIDEVLSATLVPKRVEQWVERRKAAL